MIKLLQRKIRFTAFDANTRLIFARFYLKRFIRHLRHFGLPAAVALLVKTDL